jgi:O-succinylbenzoic acid--CoA ligase
MNNQNFNSVHLNFKWNGISLDREKLLLAAHDLIKEGNDSEKTTGEFLLEWFNVNSYIIATSSGTTGIPKKITIDKQAMVNSALATAEFFDLKRNEKSFNDLKHILDNSLDLKDIRKMKLEELKKVTEE